MWASFERTKLHYVSTREAFFRQYSWLQSLANTINSPGMNTALFIHSKIKPLASFPGFPHFHLPFAYTIINWSRRWRERLSVTNLSSEKQKTSEKWGRPGPFIMWMMSSGHKVDVGGEEPNCQNNTLDHSFEHSTTPDLTMIQTTCLDR